MRADRIRELVSRVDHVALADRLGVRHDGRNMRCLWHDDNQASASLHRDGIHCHAGCGPKDASDLVMETQGCSRSAAGVWLAEYLGEPVDDTPDVEGAWAAWCTTRRMPAGVRERWRGQLRVLHGRPAFVFPTPFERERIRFLDGAQPKTRWGRKTAANVAEGCWYGLHELCELPPGTLYVVNGEPSVWAAQGQGVRATCTLLGEGKLPAPRVLELLVQYPGPVRVVYDLDDAGRRAGAALAKALAEVGVPDVAALELPADLGAKGDVDDLQRRVGAGLAAALEALAPLGEAPADSPEEPADERPEIEITTEEHLVNDAAVAALAKAPDLFCRAGRLVRLVRPQVADTALAASVPTIEAFSSPMLRETLTSHARWWRWDQRGNKAPAHPPGWCIEAVQARGVWPQVRPLTAIVEAPALRRDGSAVAQPGYDGPTGLYLLGDGVGELGPCAQDDARAAAEELLEVVQDVPFADPAHRAAWVAALLTPLARWAFAGPAPLTLIEANVQGAGKGLCAELIGLILTGRPIPTTSTDPSDPDEMRKFILGAAMAGTPMLLIDNVTGRLGCAPLEAAMTSTTITDRVLGESRQVTLTMAAVWFATGNNVRLSPDMTRRVLHVRLESPEERPEERTGFTIPDIRGWVLRHRARLLRAALCVLRGYCAAGRPSMGLRPWGSYEGWSDLVRSAVVWAGLADPHASSDSASEGDEDTAALRTLLAAWPADGGGLVHLKASELLERAKDPHRGPFGEAVRDMLPEGVEKLSAKAVGRCLARYLGRVLAGRKLARREDRNGVMHWFAVDMGGGR